MLDRRPSLTDDVLSALRQGIRESRFRSGELYSVYQVAEWLGVSRSPVREALLKLAEAGLVEVTRNRGFRVVLPKPRDLAEIFAVRMALEVPAAGRFAASAVHDQVVELQECLRSMEQATDEEGFWAADRRLHHLILVGAGNARAARIVRELRDTTSLLGAPTERPFPVICREHASIVEAVASGEAARAEQSMRSHLTDTGLLLMARVSGSPTAPGYLEALWDEVVGQG